MTKLHILLFVSASFGVALAEPIIGDTETFSLNDTGRSILLDPLPQKATLAFAVRDLGMLECAGADRATGGSFWENFIGTGGDSGDLLCQPSCGGECVQNQAVVIARGQYPFGCRCAASRCNAEGPMVTSLPRDTFKVVCDRDTRCSCLGVGPGYHVGYMCNWLNVKSHRPVSFLDRPSRPGAVPTYSPVRWCSCCPQKRIDSPFQFGNV